MPTDLTPEPTPRVSPLRGLLRTASIAGLLVVAISASGCAPVATTDPGATKASSATESATPSTSPSISSPTMSSSSSAATDDPETWVVTQTGAGPVELAGSFAAARDHMPEGTSVDTQNCAWSASWQGPAFSLVAVRAREGTDESPLSLVSSMSRGDKPKVAVGPKTAEGIGVGSTVSAVRAAYPDAVEGISSVGAVPFLRDNQIFFSYRDDWVERVTVTLEAEPPYEICG